MYLLFNLSGRFIACREISADCLVLWQKLPQLWACIDAFSKIQLPLSHEPTTDCILQQQCFHPQSDGKRRELRPQSLVRPLPPYSLDRPPAACVSLLPSGRRTTPKTPAATTCSALPVLQVPSSMRDSSLERTKTFALSTRKKMSCPGLAQFRVEVAFTSSVPSRHSAWRAESEL